KRFDERNAGKNIPRGDGVDAAEVATDRRDRGQAGKPVFPGANLFVAQVGQDEIDGGGDRVGRRVEAQQFVRRAVGTRGVCAHTEAVGNGLELFRFLVDTSSTAPPPRLVHEGSMRRIHQPDNPVIHIAGQVGADVGQFVFFAEYRQ